MTLVLLVYIGGILSILSPCILPVLPFVFARGDQPFVRSSLPLLLGMTLTFAGVASLAAVAGGWAVYASQYGRYVALAVLALFALTLLSDRLAAFLTRPAVAIGERLSGSLDGKKQRSGPATSLVIGVATGFLWAPCAGPILGLVEATAALKGASVGTAFLLFAYAVGAATSLSIALLAGGRVFSAIKHYLATGVLIRRGLGVAVLAAVAATATGLDTDILSNVTTIDTTPVEQNLISTFGIATRHKTAGPVSPQPSIGDHQTSLSGDLYGASLIPAAFTGTTFDISSDIKPIAAQGLGSEGSLPSLAGATEWINSAPLTAASLRGKVVLVNIWTYACINCRHVLPYVKAWAAKYRNAGLVVVGVHTPELAFERLTANVRQAVRNYGIGYPVAVDTNSTIWNSFSNEFWPSNYFADTRGRLRYHHFGEGDYMHQEDVIRELLREAGAGNLPDGYVSLEGDAERFAASEPRP
jgi:cytochrome c biogenesis protein CcdA/thiol-disulfide isomerase/thioredoxin